MKRIIVLGADVHENIAALREALGSVDRPLSFAGLAKRIGVGATSVQRWEKEGAEPDIQSIRRMAELAGVTYEEFALGDPEKRADPFGDDVEFPRSPLHREILEDEGEEAERPPSRRAAGESKKPKR